jgi:hypothetical protein
MIAALLGVLVCKEFRGSPSGTFKLLVAMFACFLAGLTLIVYMPRVVRFLGWLRRHPGESRWPYNPNQ